MNSHLTSEEIYQWLSGERGNEVEEHLRECPACQADLHQFRQALAGFRNSLEQSPVPPVYLRPALQIIPRWFLAAAAVLLLAAAPIYWTARQQRAAEQSRTDELLLERVNTGLSRAVPASMEPLMQLVSKEEK